MTRRGTRRMEQRAREAAEAIVAGAPDDMVSAIQSADHSQAQTGVNTPVTMEAVVVPEGVPFRCLPRNAACVILYGRIAFSFIILIIGVVGLIVSEGSCFYEGLVLAVLGFWLGVASSPVRQLSSA